MVVVAALSGQSAAQELDELPFGGEVRVEPVGYPARGGYEGRSIETVYDCLSNVFSNGSHASLGVCSEILEDVSFAPGPWGQPSGSGPAHLITEVSYGIAFSTTPTSTEQILLIFWDRDDVRFEGQEGALSSMVRLTAEPLGVVRIDLGVLVPFAWHLTADLSGMPGGGIAVPPDDNGIALQVAWVYGGCQPTRYQDMSQCVYEGCSSTTNRRLSFGSNTLQPAGGNPASIGSTIPSYGRDIGNSAMCGNIGWFVGNGGPSVNQGNIEHRSITAGAGSSQLGYELLLRGTVNTQCCNADFNRDGDFGTDADIEAFFGCLAGDCCGTCPGSADFNCDGNIGTEQDVEGFFRVLAGGSC
jgi:hypothetical protein